MLMLVFTTNIKIFVYSLSKQGKVKGRIMILALIAFKKILFYLSLLHHFYKPYILHCIIQIIFGTYHFDIF